MKPTDWSRVEELLHEALGLDPPRRPEFLAGITDPDIRAEVESLLEADQGPPAATIETVIAEAAAGFAIAPARPESGAEFGGRYRLIRVIGEGGMGTVYAAQQRTPVQRTVALKLIRSGMDSRQMLARFEAERQSLAMMDHPNIATVLDAGEAPDGRPYFVMELVEGASITEYCNARRLTIRQRLELFLPVCQAVQHAHHKGIIHRDIKPSNIIVTEYDGKPVPKVIDFGLAKAAEASFTASTALTHFGTVVGTLQYMSPEQARFEGRDLDTRTDIYSLGAVLYELLTGTTPLEFERLADAVYSELLRRIAEEDPRPPSERVVSSPELLTRVSGQTQTESGRLKKMLAQDLDWVVMRALEKDRTRRYTTANALLRDIERYLSGDAVEAGPPSKLYRLRKFAHRHSALLAVGLVFAVVLAAAAAVSIGFAIRADRERRTAVAAMHQVHAQQLIAFANEGLRTDPERSIILAMHAVHATQQFNEPVLLGAEAILHKSVLSSQVRGTYRGHTNEVRGVAFSPDGKRLATCADDRTVRIWDVESQRQALLITTSSPWIWAVEFSPDGRFVAAANPDSTITIYDSTSGGLVQTLRGHESGVTSLVFMRDGRKLVTGSQDRTLRVWDLENGRTVSVLRGHRLGVWSVALSPDGKWIASGGDDKVLRIYDAVSGRESRRLNGHRDTIRSVAFSPDGTRLISAGQDQTARLWDVASGTEKRVVTDQGGQMRSAVFADNGDAFITAGSGVRMWETSFGSSIAEFPGHHDLVLKVALSLDGRRFATASSDGTAKVWDSPPGTEHELKFLGDSQAGREALQTGTGREFWGLSPDASRCAAFRANGPSVTILDTQTGRHIATLPGSRTETRTAAFSPDGGLFATASSDGRVLVWDARSGALIREWKAPGKVSGVAVSSRWMALIGDEQLRIVDLKTAKSIMIRELQGAVTSVAISPDGHVVAGGRRDGTVMTWRLATGDKLQTFNGHGKRVHSVLFSPDGERLVSKSEENEVRIWNVRTGAQLALLPRIRANLAFDPSGTRLAVSGIGTAIYDGHYGTLLMRLEPTFGPSGFFADVHFSGDGKRLVEMEFGTVQTYAMDVSELMKIARRRVTRELTQEECGTFFGSPVCPALPE